MQGDGSVGPPPVPGASWAVVWGKASGIPRSKDSRVVLFILRLLRRICGSLINLVWVRIDPRHQLAIGVNEPQIFRNSEAKSFGRKIQRVQERRFSYAPLADERN